jgi:hypothetical protein
MESPERVVKYESNEEEEYTSSEGSEGLEESSRSQEKKSSSLEVERTAQTVKGTVRERVMRTRGYRSVKMANKALLTRLVKMVHHSSAPHQKKYSGISAHEHQRTPRTFRRPFPTL